MGKQGICTKFFEDNRNFTVPKNDTQNRSSVGINQNHIVVIEQANRALFGIRFRQIMMAKDSCKFLLQLWVAIYYLMQWNAMVRMTLYMKLDLRLANRKQFWPKSTGILNFRTTPLAFKNRYRGYCTIALSSCLHRLYFGFLPILIDFSFIFLLARIASVTPLRSPNKMYALSYKVLNRYNFVLSE